MWCDLNVDGQTIRVFNNHLQTTEVSQNKRRLERELAKNELTGREEAVAKQLLEGLNENFRKTAEEYNGKADVIFVCVKGYSVDSITELIKRAAHDRTIVIPILNVYGTGP
ncbi:2-dehydropantoate 2-reductase N-terminal domain-containing protein, partial [Bacteroides fragilis]|uniref:2-dehydropantoate 2-reductase N-terminal domain-containing protein n=1 Tax=Bacteroides fragilis TaxID=817 RepID=UPI00374F12E5